MLTEEDRRRVEEADAIATGQGVPDRFTFVGDPPGWAFMLREMVALVRRQEEANAGLLGLLRRVASPTKPWNEARYCICPEERRDSPYPDEHTPLCEEVQRVLAQHPKEGRG